MFEIKMHNFVFNFHYLKLYQLLVWIINDFCTILKRTLRPRVRNIYGMDVPQFSVANQEFDHSRQGVPYI